MIASATPRVTYMMRRTLCPWKRDSLVKETLAWAQAQGMDEMVWITESSGMYKELLPLSEIQGIVDALAPVKAATEAAGLVYSLNPLTTMGHGDYGHVIKEIHPDLDLMVGHTGQMSRTCACPRSPYWLELMGETFALYASTQPARLWVEDDFRLMNHGAGVRYGCYCDAHLRAFSARVGETVSRQQLVQTILQPGEPHPWRTIWLDMLEEDMLAVGRLLRQRVAAHSPQTELGWMSVAPALHAQEGRGVQKQMLALAGDHRAAIRMTTTHFRENSPRDLLIEDEALQKMLVQLPDGSTRCTEVETCPHSGYTTSATRIAAQIGWACVLGVPNHTLNIFDYLGTPTAESPLYDRMLRERKHVFQAFADAFAPLTTKRGVSIPANPRSARLVRTAEGEDIWEWQERECGWADPLRAFGLPIAYGQQDGVVALTGQGITCLGDESLEAIFAGAVLLDASGLEALHRCGRGDLAGVSLRGSVGNRERPIGPEEMLDPAFGGGHQHYSWTYGSGQIAVLKPAAEARPISRILDDNGEFLYHGLICYENKLGGRVVTAPYFLQGEGPDPYQRGPSLFFYTPYRRQQLHGVMHWLARTTPPLIVHTHAWTLAYRAEDEATIGVAAMNLASDAWEDLRLTVGTTRTIREVEWLDCDGQRQPLDPARWQQKGETVSVNLPVTVPCLHQVACLLSS